MRTQEGEVVDLQLEVVRIPAAGFSPLRNGTAHVCKGVLQSCLCVRKGVIERRQLGGAIIKGNCCAHGKAPGLGQHAMLAGHAPRSKSTRTDLTQLARVDCRRPR